MRGSLTGKFMLFKKMIHISFLFFIFQSCSQKDDQTENAKVLDEVGQDFKIHFPNQFQNAKSAKWDYKSRLEGGSETTIILARIQLDDTIYKNWDISLAGSLKKYNNWSPIFNADYANKYEWWDSSRFPADLNLHYSQEVKESTGQRWLDIDVATSNGNYMMYICERIIRK